MARRIPKDAMTRALAAASSDEPTAKDTAAKDTAAKDTAAKDTAAKDTAAKEAPTKEATAKDAAAKDAPAKTAAAKDAPAKAPAAVESPGGTTDPGSDDELDEADAQAMADVPDKLYFRIGEVATLVGVDAHVLRYWESEFRMKPHRSSSGQRLYRKQDLSRFFRIKRLLHDEGYTIAGARKVLSSNSGTAQQVDVPRVREALDRITVLRDRILELRDEMDPEGRA